MKDEKIFEEEMLNDEELDNVVGGTTHESLNDMRLLTDVSMKDASNEYYIGDQQVTRETAMKYVPTISIF